jgi:hypothetical protein
MTIPSTGLFPEEYDSDLNLFLVHDALRVRLLDDYKPGDTSILVEGDTETMSRFPLTGVVTLTEQCSDIDARALSFHYSSRTSVSFDGLEILPEFSSLDSVKPKRITNVTMNVVAMHHNHLKDSLISVQENLGTKHTSDRKTITGRIKYLGGVAFRPKAWFSFNAVVGLAPLTVKFKNDSFRLGPGWVKQVWDFGDGTTKEINTYSPEEYASYTEESGGLVIEGTTIKKTYSTPESYTVSLKIYNDFGDSEVVFESAITVNAECPEQASIKIDPKSTQSYTDGDPAEGTYPKIRSAAGQFIDLEIPEGENPLRPGFSYAGEPLKPSGAKVDPIAEYTWSLGDDLPHVNSPLTRASYSKGGAYDIILRVDTTFGSYRITKYEDAIDIVENRNLWLFNFNAPQNEDGSGTVKAYEFGLLGETFKLLGNQVLSVDRSRGFLDVYDSGLYESTTKPRAISEFDKNVEFVPYGTLGSGLRGDSIIFWAKGGAVTDSSQIAATKYNAFDDKYENLSAINNRPWNWVALSSPERTYFLLGQSSTAVSGSNPVEATKTEYDLASQTASATTALGSSSLENGADELLQHPSFFSTGGVPTNGYFATYRSAWKDSVGYILRNSAVNEFFRMANFYKTRGNLASPFNAITKLPDMTGSVKVEGELVSMSNGIFFFNNSGEISAWNDTTLTWEVGRTGSAALTFRTVQDSTKSSFDDKSNTLLAASDGDRIAYLSYDYSDKAFVKFNGTDLTFTALKYRPAGVQFKMGVY